MSRKERSPAKGGSGRTRRGLLQAPWVPPTALIILIALVYARSLASPILEWDDFTYFFRDARLDPITWGSLWRVLTESFLANYHPLTTLTIAFDRAVWGTWVPGFHVTQWVLYAVGILGLYILFHRILGARSAAFVAAALYAAHAVHVESVVWLASRKDVVCLIFYAFAILAYIRYADSPEIRWKTYLLSIVLAAAAMLSKGYAVILPAVFVAYDLCFSARVTRRQILDKIPFAVITVLTIILTVLAQDRDSTLIQSTTTAGRRVALLAKVFALYVGHTLLPINLSAFYTVARGPAGSLAQLGMLLAAALIAAFFFLRRRVPTAAFGIALFLLPFGTVMNFFFTLRIWMADRYLFFPTIGSSLALVAIATALAKRTKAPPRPRPSRSFRVGLAGAATVVIVIYSGLTIARVELWTDRVALWSDAVRKQLHLAGSGPVTARTLGRVTNLGAMSSAPVLNLESAYRAAGHVEEADAIAGLFGRMAGSGDVDAELARAQEDLDAGRSEEALKRLRPIADGRTLRAPLAMILMGFALDRLGNADESGEMLRRGIKRYRETGQPATDGLFEIGSREFNQGHYAKAAEWFTLARQESPKEARAAYYLGLALAESGDLAGAMKLYTQIVNGELSVLPGTRATVPNTYLQMAVVMEKQGRTQDAIRYLEEVLRREPDHPEREAILKGLETFRAQIPAK